MSRGHDHCDASSASHQAACFTRSTAPDKALPSLMRQTRPLSVCSETRLRPSFIGILARLLRSRLAIGLTRLAQLEKDTPVSRAVERTGHILCRPVLGGLHHQYIRI